MADFNTIIQKVIGELSQVPGPGVQTYAEGRIGEKVQQTFNLVFPKLWWPGYMQWFSRTIDGVNGLVSQQITTIASSTDIRAVFPANSNRPLSVLPTTLNPNTLSGTTARYIEGTNNTSYGCFSVWPRTATTDVSIHARIHPGTFNVSDTTDIVMDNDLLVFGAAWSYAEDDGTNPAQAAKFQALFEAKLDQLEKLYNKQVIDLKAGYSGEIPLDWYYA